ncbi:uncharacterized protein LOC126747452 isoform X2 [Anthonomus grandis grandis]|uniref:uncharacterized protein LOC126747452 isoform X1 n=1 Tax=Anthonomus grandis grandis TaxID=2921223 RepID=UPI002164F4E8|nr:uncharacterized protein LOC126747452 isoform X1 [Anthonomus grandis grandis]XP_050312065.1 uncharacterized protein LOC126747452 isoform X2 [Anthonomus grandis grandis]
MMQFDAKFIFTLMLVIFAVIVDTAPRPGQEWDRFNNPCIYDDLKVETCQRCAKQTKSPIVYPMCCNEEDNVYEWCEKYIHFGRKP